MGSLGFVARRYPLSKAAGVVAMYGRGFLTLDGLVLNLGRDRALVLGIVTADRTKIAASTDTEDEHE